MITTDSPAVAAALKNRFNEHFTAYVFKHHDRRHALLLDLVNAAQEDRNLSDIRGRFVRFVPNRELTEKFFEREHTWLAVGEALTDLGEQATVVLQLFKHRSFELSYFMSDCGELQFTRDQAQRPKRLWALRPDRPVVIVSIFRQAITRYDDSAQWHQIMKSTWLHHAKTVEIIHFVNGRKMDAQPESLPRNRLRLWMDYLCGRDAENFEQRVAGDAVFERLLSLERGFAADPAAMEQYLKTEDECAATERLLSIWRGDGPSQGDAQGKTA